MLQVLAGRHGLPAAPLTPAQPLEQLRADMLQAVQLIAHLQTAMQSVPAEAVKVEMRIAPILAQMEVTAMGELDSSSSSVYDCRPLTADNQEQGTRAHSNWHIKPAFKLAILQMCRL